MNSDEEYIDTYFSDIILKYHRSEKDLEKHVKCCTNCKKVKKFKLFDPGESVCKKCKKLNLK
jgi:hypothetical protein